MCKYGSKDPHQCGWKLYSFNPISCPSTPYLGVGVSLPGRADGQVNGRAELPNLARKLIRKSFKKICHFFFEEKNQKCLKLTFFYFTFT